MERESERERTSKCESESDREKERDRKRQPKTEGVFEWVGESESAKSITSMHAKKNRLRRRVRAPAGTPR